MTLFPVCIQQFSKELFTQEGTEVFSVLLDVKAQTKQAPVGRSSGVPSHPAHCQQQEPFKMCKLNIFLLGGTVMVSHLLPSLLSLISHLKHSFVGFLSG